MRMLSSSPVKTLATSRAFETAAGDVYIKPICGVLTKDEGFVERPITNSDYHDENIVTVVEKAYAVHSALDSDRLAIFPEYLMAFQAARESNRTPFAAH